MARPIMIQGTTSNAGKSLLCAALCRIFYREGLRVAPFKSQNMALNSYVTPDGLEMGRAQALQAQAAGRKCDVRMNPILLKPTSDVGSQVIVNGVSRGNMKAKEYFRRKQELIPDIMDAYNGLAAENDVVVIEGAGSPAEINLKENDIVNMGLAAMVDAPVLLVGDIDPGGVFASLYGTVALLEHSEQERIQGFVINKFRGDKSILDPGLVMLEKLTGIPVAGVVPWLEVELDDEDSLSQRLKRRSGEAAVDIAVVRLPRISNFTDFNPLERFGEVSLRYVRSPADLGAPDLVILPGTKNTLADLRWVKETGFAEKILNYERSGGPVVGICGGYQMLGQSVSDPLGVEGGGREPGLGLLRTQTVLGGEKQRRRVQGQVASAQGIFASLTGQFFRGYELHVGCTQSQERPFAALAGDGWDGAAAGNVLGTYVHGIFDEGEFSAALVNALLREKGLPESAKGSDWKAHQEKELDRLADAVEQSLDMKLIHELVRA